ncbi:PKD domain-containing protein [Subsaximicrobium wynnwilliamsii]|uniref:PKD domain-containing protein n=1 Tax=Subsaximicrobium wynnwilliamsii TaxID=291179 RepID=A0A5C6ZFR8_9FLAO|nr:PKD domain-containing protein [Subsaximicrobium wynnwilliamsii]TXD81967.1 PKD domain-containing protein [Subsaximicrobium wynnwilliamsii]TXD87665.1 PKD domain-containing protein [Subsaximicrobium wynnwilliamsii]TXE01412.1 PKD domain-containing protein [Subsaximicrobium wynnwilliamsii]
MKNIIKGIKIVFMLSLAFSFSGCDDDDENLPKIEALFTHTINQEAGVVTFINASSNADSYSWDFGDGTASTENNPTKIYTSGVYTIVLTAKNVAGATDTFEDTITIQIPEDIALPITFDDPLVAYDATTFEGTSFAVVENPDASGANDLVSNVGAITNSGAVFEGLFFDLGLPLDLSTDKSVTMKFWSQIPINVLVKLEAGNGVDVETTASHGGSGWEDIYFTFDSAVSYSKFTMFVDGSGTTAGAFYMDDVEQLNSDDVPCLITELALPFDFDCESIDYSTKITGDVSFAVVDNPELSGINDQLTKVGQITNVGNQFENAFFNLDTPIDFATDKGVRFKLFSNQALPVLLKFEDGTDVDVEDTEMHGGTGWEELTFTLNSSASYNDMILFVDGAGNAVGTFYVDDFEQVFVNLGTPCTPEVSQSLNAADFNLTFLNDPTASITSDGAGFAWIDNPDFDNTVNTSCKVGQIDRTSAAQFANNQITLDAKLDFNTNSGFKLKVWSSTSETPVLLKLEDQNDAGIFKEVPVTTSAGSAMQWEELTFNFAAGDSNKYDKIVLFFALGTSTEAIYYIDDLALFSDGGGSTGGGGCDGDAVAATSLPVDFEDCESFISTFSSVESNPVLTSLVDNPASSGINTSDYVLRITKPSGINRWGGIQNSFPAGTIDFTTQTFKVKVYSSYSDVTYRFELALDPQTTPVTGNPAPQFRQVSGGANEWVEIEFTFINLPPSGSPTTYNQLVIKPDNPDGTDGDVTTEERVYYIDDLRLD